jgi:hypothetical protein
MASNVGEALTDAGDSVRNAAKGTSETMAGLVKDAGDLSANVWSQAKGSARNAMASTSSSFSDLASKIRRISKPGKEPDAGALPNDLHLPEDPNPDENQLD